MTHPVFQRMPPDRRWQGERLEALWMTLVREAKAVRLSPETIAANKGWSWRILARGAVVGVRYRRNDGHRLELRIARVDPPTDEDAWARWEREKAIFLSKFGIRMLNGLDQLCEHEGRDWTVIDDGRSEGRAATRFMELRKGEVTPGNAVCEECLDGKTEVKRIPWEPGAARQLCATCKLAVGKARDRDRWGRTISETLIAWALLAFIVTLALYGAGQLIHLLGG